MIISDGHIEIVASNRQQVALSVADITEFEMALGGKVSRNWPFQELSEGMPWAYQSMTTSKVEIGYWVWWVTKISGREVIGYVGFKGPPTSSGKLEITFALDPDYRGQGYGLGATKLLMRWAFSQPRVKWIVADTEPDNKAARNLLLKLGFALDAGASEKGELIFQKVKT